MTNVSFKSTSISSSIIIEDHSKNAEFIDRLENLLVDVGYEVRYKVGCNKCWIEIPHNYDKYKFEELISSNFDLNKINIKYLNNDTISL